MPNAPSPPPDVPTALRPGADADADEIRVRARRAALVASESIERAIAVVLFGSLARSSAVQASSDVDLLVVASTPHPTRAMRDYLGELVGRDVSLLVHTPSSLKELHRRDWSFVEHLRREHEVVIDQHGVLGGLLQVRHPQRHDIKKEMRAHLDALAYLDDPAVLSGQHLTSYSRLYAAAKSVAILDALQAGEAEFDRRAAFASWRARHPGAAELAYTVETLEPFFLRLRRRARVSLPWAPWEDTERLGRVTSTVRQLIRESAR